MASFLTIPLYKFVCNLSYIDDLQNNMLYSKEWCVYNMPLSFVYSFVSNMYPASFSFSISNYIDWHVYTHWYDALLHETISVNDSSCTDRYKSINLVKDESVTYYNVTFFTRVSNFTLLEFVSLQDSILVTPGEPVLVFFRIYNPTGVALTGMSMYFVYPSSVAVFVSKVQCFCFDLLQVKQNESVELPVIFYVDETILLDKVCFDNTIYLSYVFFIQ